MVLVKEVVLVLVLVVVVEMEEMMMIMALINAIMKIKIESFLMNEVSLETTNIHFNIDTDIVSASK